MVHYAEHRLLTVREQAALQSFPDDYVFLGTERDQIRQVGNAVPIELSRAIARSVKECLRFRYVEEDGFSVAAALKDLHKKGPLPADVDEDEIAEDLERVDYDSEEEKKDEVKQGTADITGEAVVMATDKQPPAGTRTDSVVESMMTEQRDETMAD